MQIGDAVQVTGTVKDIVAGSVLVQSDPSRGNPGREYWFLAADVVSQSTPTAAESAAAEAAEPAGT